MIDEFPAVKIMRLEPGDIVVAEFSTNITQQDMSHWLKELQTQFGGHKVVATAPGLELKVMRPESVQA